MWLWCVGHLTLMETPGSQRAATPVCTFFEENKDQVSNAEHGKEIPETTSIRTPHGLGPYERCPLHCTIQMR